MSVTIEIPKEYGYVVAVLAAASILNAYLAGNVSMARKKYGIKYPNMYAPEGHKHAAAFNCAQRAHQNTLETMSHLLIVMLVCGLFYPVTSAALGATWIVGRFIYGWGYVNNGPGGRHPGSLISHLGDIPLFVMAFKVAYEIISA